MRYWNFVLQQIENNDESSLMEWLVRKNYVYKIKNCILFNSKFVLYKFPKGIYSWMLNWIFFFYFVVFLIIFEHYSKSLLFISWITYRIRKISKSWEYQFLKIKYFYMFWGIMNLFLFVSLWYKYVCKHATFLFRHSHIREQKRQKSKHCICLRCNLAGMLQVTVVQTV